MSEEWEQFRELSKEVRQERLKNFEEKWLPKFTEVSDMKLVDKEALKYSVTMEKWGEVYFFPKANKVLIKKENRWIERGLPFLIKQFKIKKT